MACMENIPSINVDSEMEEGEIVDDLSDISSEEEYLLRERLAVLENYNNVLERKKTKRSSVGPDWTGFGKSCVYCRLVIPGAFSKILGTIHKKEDALLHDLSEISTTDFEYYSPFKDVKAQKYQKPYHRQKRKKDGANDVYKKSRDYKKKNGHPKKRLQLKVISESSEESGDDYKNQRKKLAEAVVVNKGKNDKTSLSERLQKMLCGVNPEPVKLVIKENKPDTHLVSNIKSLPIKPPVSSQYKIDDNIIHLNIQNVLQEPLKSSDVIDICSDEDNKTIVTLDTVDSGIEIKQHQKDDQKNLDTPKDLEKDSDDDLELLRQHALKTKTVNTKKNQDGPLSSENKNLSDEEDSDTAELRLICLKSAIIKKAIEMKQKQKLQKRLSQSSNIQDDSLEHAMLADTINSDNITDIESVDMDIGSDGEDKLKESSGEYNKNTINGQGVVPDKHIPVLMVKKDDELEEDEDLLRAKLLTSLSKKLPKLVDPNVIKATESVKDPECVVPNQLQPEEKRFIINLESDSEEENESTRNLKKMHMRLCDQKDFQQKLDMFLKSTRMEVENTTLPDVVQKPVSHVPKKSDKYVVKAVKNLPKSEQIEYKYLVKRMAELEKIKQARQSTMGLVKDSLKPKNTTINTSHLSLINNLEEKINTSRKNIAEESAKMLKLKEEGIKLSQKFEIVATELRNIKTALALNKKQQRSVQNYLTKIRQHHQMLLKSSLASTHSKVNVMQHSNKINSSIKMQSNVKNNANVLHKEICKENNLNPIIISVKNDFKKNSEEPSIDKMIPPVIQHPRLSVEVDVTNDKKVVKLSDKGEINYSNDIESESLFENKTYSSHPVEEKGGGVQNDGNHQRRNSDDYRSPLDVFGSTVWSADPNAILCPFEVCGDCKDADCKYLHTNTISK